MNPFTFASAKNILCQTDATSKLTQILSSLQAGKILLITDKGLSALALHKNTTSQLQEAGIECLVFDAVAADPSDDIVEQALALAKQSSVDAIIGFGGGSSMDVAKLVAYLASEKCPHSLSDCYGVDKIAQKRLPLIQIPTTAGTGSEVTPVAIVTTGATTKSAVVSDTLLPDWAILDASLTTSLPASVTAATGIDAIVHAIEAYTSNLRKNPVSDMLAKEALRLLASNIRLAVFDGSNLEARQAMLLGAMMAGQAFANAPVAAVHALAYPLGGHFHIPHGLSNSLVLPHVLRFNAEHQKAERLYAELAPIIVEALDQEALLSRLQKNRGNAMESCETLIAGLEDLVRDLELPATLSEMGIKETDLPRLAADAMLQERLLVNNPRPLKLEDALNIYTQAFG